MMSQPAVLAVRGVAPPVHPQYPVGLPPERGHSAPGGLAFHQLATPAQFAQVSHLRTEIQLPEGVRADPAFTSREKKETRPASWVPLRCTAATLEPFGLSR